MTRKIRRTGIDVLFRSVIPNAAKVTNFDPGAKTGGKSLRKFFKEYKKERQKEEKMRETECRRGGVFVLSEHYSRSQ